MLVTQKVPQLSNIAQHPWYAEAAEGGTLYLNSNPAAQIGTELLRHVVDSGIPPDVEIMNPGNFAGTYAQGDTVIKRFWTKNGNTARDPNISGLGYLRASVALHSGLLAVSASLPPELRSRNGTRFEYTAPEMFGAFVPDQANGERATIVAMSKATGNRMKLWGNGTLRPTYRMRRQTYRHALSAIGVDPGEVFFDPNPDNTLLHQKSDDSVQVTRLDVSARVPFRRR